MTNCQYTLRHKLFIHSLNNLCNQDYCLILDKIMLVMGLGTSVGGPAYFHVFKYTQSIGGVFVVQNKSAYILLQELTQEEEERKSVQLLGI